MRLEKKKMATLLAAILIAMMGVMQALAADTGVATLTATVLPDIVSITVSTPVAFGNVMRSATPTAGLTVTVGGETGSYVDLQATLVDDSEETFFDPLTITDDTPALVGTVTVATPLTWNVALGTHDYELSFTVPGTALAQPHSGTLTIFAIYNP